MGSINADGIHVAIVGGGIAGVTLALGLQRRGVSFTLYERAASIAEVGAGIGLSPNAERAMEMLDAETVLGAFKRAVTPNGLDYFQWIDGVRTDEIRFKLHMGRDAFQGCRRSDLIEEMLKSVPADRVQLGKQAESVRETTVRDPKAGQAAAGGGTHPGRAVEITFTDGTVAHADVLVGCDGIRSRVRQVLFGPDNPASHPGYTGKYCFRTLVPFAKARAVLGHDRTHTRYMYNGHGAHAITYPVGQGPNLVLNVLIVLSDPRPGGWPLAETGGRHTAPGTRAEVKSAVAGFHPTFQKIVDMLPEGRLEKWAIFDSMENPAPTYARGPICLAGDAAHASGPHLGAGAGFGIEDALALSVLLEAVNGRLLSAQAPSEDRRELIGHALKVYDELRIERTQWLVRATREAVDMFHWKDVGEDGKVDWEEFGRRITSRFYQIWDYDLDGMVTEALGNLELATKG